MAALDVIEALTNTSGGANNATNSITFAATPSNGELLLFFVAKSDVNSAFSGLPSGITTYDNPTGTNERLGVFGKVASGEASATYSFTSGVDTKINAFRIEGPFTDLSTITFGDNGVAGAATSRTILASGAVSVPANTLVIASIAKNNTSAVSFTNSFANSLGDIVFGANSTLSTVRRLYTSADTGVQTVASWTGGNGSSSVLMEIEAPAASTVAKSVFPFFLR